MDTGTLWSLEKFQYFYQTSRFRYYYIQKMSLKEYMLIKNVCVTNRVPM